MQKITIPFYLALKEIWRNRGRFFLFSLVIALITVLVLFIAALGEGLANNNREFLLKLNADLLVYQEKSDFIIGASRLDRSQINAVRRVNNVLDAGPLGFATVTLLLPNSAEELKVSAIGVEPGRPGEPTVDSGRQLSTDNAREMIIDRDVVLRTGIQVGQDVTLRVTQGTKDEFYTLRVVGTTDGRKYSFQPSVFTPFFTWDRIRPKSQAEINRSEAVANVFAVRLKDGASIDQVKKDMAIFVGKVETITIPGAIEALPGYSAQQSTVQTQAVFTLLIGILVIGGFFQIQVLQKVPQIGVLKAIGTTTMTVGAASIIQIIVVTLMGVGIGGLGTFLLSLTFPATIPIVFDGQATLIAVIALVLIGPLGGIVSVRYAVRIEPLRALGLSS